MVKEVIASGGEMSERPPTHADAMLFMEYYKLWDTPLDGEAWTWYRTLKAEGGLDSFRVFESRVSPSSREYVLFDRVLCAFEQAGVLMKHGLLHPDLYFDAWASPASVWNATAEVVRGLRNSRGNDHLYANLEWIAARAEAWYQAHEPPTEPAGG
jgi:hypothetical protein